MAHKICIRRECTMENYTGIHLYDPHPLHVSMFISHLTYVSTIGCGLNMEMYEHLIWHVITFHLARELLVGSVCMSSKY